MIGFLTIRNHSRLRGLLSAYIDGEVTESDAGRVEQHLAGCDQCRAELDTLRMTVGLLRELPPLTVPRSFALTEEPAPVRQLRPVAWAAPLATSVAALLLVALLASDLSGVVSQTRVMPDEAATVQLEAAPVGSLPLPAQAPVPAAAPPAAVAAAAAAPAPLAVPSPESTPAPALAIAAAPLESEEVTTAAEKIVQVEAESDVAAAEAAIAPQAAETKEEMESEGLEQRSVEPEEEVTAGVEVMAEQLLTEPQAAAPLMAMEPVPPVSAEPQLQKVDESRGLSLPLWQLETALGGLFAALALLTLWMLRRRSRQSY